MLFERPRIMTEQWMKKNLKKKNKNIDIKIKKAVLKPKKLIDVIFVKYC